LIGVIEELLTRFINMNFPYAAPAANILSSNGKTETSGPGAGDVII
jgi:hypothetical protein